MSPRVITPIEEPRTREVPGGAVEELHEVGARVKLREREELRALLVVVADVVEGLRDAFEFGGGLGLDHDHRDAVHEEGEVGADVGRPGVRASGQYDGTTMTEQLC